MFTTQIKEHNIVSTGSASLKPVKKNSQKSHNHPAEPSSLYASPAAQQEVYQKKEQLRCRHFIGSEGVTKQATHSTMRTIYFKYGQRPLPSHAIRHTTLTTESRADPALDDVDTQSYPFCHHSVLAA